VLLLIDQATDADVLTEHSTVVYVIVDGDPRGNFSINSTTGRIGVTTPLDYEMISAELNGTFTLTVMAVDSQKPSLYDTAIVTIHVNVRISFYLLLFLQVFV